MQGLNNKSVTLFSLGGGGAALLLAFFSGSLWLALPAAFFFCLALLAWKYGYIFFPAVAKAAGWGEMHEGYEVPASQDCLVKKGGDQYYASVFLAAHVSESVMEMAEKEKTIYMEMFERAVSSFRFPVKFSLVVNQLDLTNYVDELKTKRNYAETKKGRLLSSGDATQLAEVTRLDREIAMWNRQLSRINAGERPMQTACYLMTTANGLTKEQAMARARNQRDEVCSVVGNALNVEVVPLKAEEMKTCFAWEKILPASEAELRDNLF